MFGFWNDKEGRQLDYVIDVIDNIDIKVVLFKYCYDYKFLVIFVIGVGCKFDLICIIVGDIVNSMDDRFFCFICCKFKFKGIMNGIFVVYLMEKIGEGKVEFLFFLEDEFQCGKVGDFGVMLNF